jgi:hypothetical protein
MFGLITKDIYLRLADLRKGTGHGQPEPAWS